MFLKSMSVFQNSSLFNGLLKALQRLPRIRIVDVRVSKLFHTVAQAPTGVASENVLDSATSYDPLNGIGYSLVPGVNPDRDLFWECVHSTGKGHEFIANYALHFSRMH